MKHSGCPHYIISPYLGGFVATAWRGLVLTLSRDNPYHIISPYLGSYVVASWRGLSLTLSLGARPAGPSPWAAGATPRFANLWTPFDRALSVTRQKFILEKGRSERRQITHAGTGGAKGASPVTRRLCPVVLCTVYAV